MKPLALCLFSCAGGIDVGLERAGFDTIGVDWMPSQQPKDSPHYSRNDGTQHWAASGECHMADLSTADAIEAVIRAFQPDLVTASPPCQRFSVATPTKNREDHPDLIASTREGILRTGVPGWIENVATDAVPLTGFWIMLCGIMFPETYHIKRHRRFELLRWKVQQPYHDGGACLYGFPGHACGKSVCMPEEKRAIVTTIDGATSERGAHRGGQWAEKGKPLADERKRRVAVAVAVAVAGHGAPDAKQSARYKRGGGRNLLYVQGHGAGGETYKRDRERAARECVGVFGVGLDGPGQFYGQNRPGPECIRWREAMGWEDGPRDRYSLAQAIPPAYGEWLGRAFLKTKGRDE